MISLLQSGAGAVHALNYIYHLLVTAGSSYNQSISDKST